MDTTENRTLSARQLRRQTEKQGIITVFQDIDGYFRPSTLYYIPRW